MVKPGRMGFWWACWTASGAMVLGNAATSGLPQDLKELVDRALDSTNDTIRTQALYALDRMGAGAISVVPALIEGLFDDPEPRWPDEDLPAVNALNAIGSPAVEGLLRVVTDMTHPGRAAAIRALGRVRHEHALTRLVAAVKEDDAQIRRSAVWALGCMKNEFATPTLVEALRHKDPETRRLSVVALSRTRGVGSDRALMSALRDENAAVRNEAAFALGGLGKIRYMPALQPLLQDPDPGVVDSVTDAIHRIERKKKERERLRPSSPTS